MKLYILTLLIMVPGSSFCPNGYDYYLSPEMEEAKKKAEDAKKKAQEIQGYLQQASQAEAGGNKQEAFEWYGKAADVQFPDAPQRQYSGHIPTDVYEEPRGLRAEAAQKLADEGDLYKKRLEYRQALDVYQLAPNYFATIITTLNKTLPFEQQLKEARELANENKFTEALAILGQENIKDLPDAMRMTMAIKGEEAEWKKKQAQAQRAQKEKWIFLREVNMPDNTKPEGWRIKNKRLEVRFDANDIITRSKFFEDTEGEDSLLTEAKNMHIPYILVAVRIGKFYYFYDVSVLQQLAVKWEDPQTRAQPDGIDIFFAGDDGKFSFLSGIRSQQETLYFIDQKVQQNEWGYYETIYVLKKILGIPGLGQLFIGDTFSQNADALGQRKTQGLLKRNEIEDKRKDLSELRDMAQLRRQEGFPHLAKAAQDDAVKLEKEISEFDELMNQNPEILKQHARQWYDWALKYLPQGSAEYNQAQQKRDAISYKPELPKAPEPVQAPATGSQVPAATGSLMQSLRNLSIKLRGLAVKLT